MKVSVSFNHSQHQEPEKQPEWEKVSEGEDEVVYGRRARSNAELDYFVSIPKEILRTFASSLLDEVKKEIDKARKNGYEITNSIAIHNQALSLLTTKIEEVKAKHNL